MLNTVLAQVCQTNLPDQSRAARVHSYSFLRSISLHSYKVHIFLGKDNANFVSFYQKARNTNGALRLYANYMVFDITRLNRNLPLLLCTFGRSFRVKYKTSTQNEIKELVKSNFLIVPSLLNESSKNMTWNNRWETKLFLRGQETARWNGKEVNNLNQVQSSWRYWTFHPTFNRNLFFNFFLIVACILQFAQYFLVTFNFLANWNSLEIPPPHLWLNFHSVRFTKIFARWQSEIWNDFLFWYFKLLFFPIARNVLNVKASVSVFFTTLLVDWPHLTNLTSRTLILIWEGQKVTDGSLKSEMRSLWGEQAI